jgi:hypothetical protein
MTPEERNAQLARERASADQAKSLAENPYLNRVLDTLEAAYFERWRDGAELSAAGREALWNALQGAIAFRQHLRAQISSGEVARAHIDKMTRTAKAG